MCYGAGRPVVERILYIMPGRISTTARICPTRKANKVLESQLSLCGASCDKWCVLLMAALSCVAEGVS